VIGCPPPRSRTPTPCGRQGDTSLGLEESEKLPLEGDTVPGGKNPDVVEDGPGPDRVGDGSPIPPMWRYMSGMAGDCMGLGPTGLRGFAGRIARGRREVRITKLDDCRSGFAVTSARPITGCDTVRGVSRYCGRRIESLSWCS
jgi:hypothetical protein